VCASQQDTGEERQPAEPQPHALSPPSSRTPRRSYILLTFRPPRRTRPDDGPLARTDSPPASEPLTAGPPETASEPLAVGPPPTASYSPPRDSLPRNSLARNDSPQVAQARTSGKAKTGIHVTRLLEASMIVIGVAMFLGALATLTSTWAWSWHASSGAILTLSQVHGICTSTMGELSQGASGTISNNCLWVDLTWTEAAGLTGVGCILVAIGVVRIVRAMRTPA
jgi:hypothetical protein